MPYITHIAHRASSQMMYLRTYSKRTNLELASPQKRCEFQSCHWLHMPGVVESPYYALHTSVSRNVAGLPGTENLHSSGPAKLLRASRTYCQRCPEIGSLNRWTGLFPIPLNWTRWGAVQCTSRTLLAVTQDGDTRADVSEKPAACIFRVTLRLCRCGQHVSAQCRYYLPDCTASHPRTHQKVCHSIFLVSVIPVRCIHSGINFIYS